MRYVSLRCCSLLWCAALLGCSAERVHIGDRIWDRAASGSSAGRDDLAGSGPALVPTGRSSPVDAALIDPIVIDHTGADNPAGLSAAEIKKLVAGGPPGDMKWLYPYDGTVFPRGTLAPAVMWNGNAATDAMYLRIKSHKFEYKAVFKPSATPGLWIPFVAASVASDPNLEALAAFAITLAQQLTGIRPTQLLIPQEVWKVAGQKSLGKGDTFTLELTERLNGKVRGPIVSHIEIAQATLKGSVYYSNCLSAMQGENPVDNFLSGSKVLRIPAGSRAELVLSQPGQVDGRCQGCHSVSADGSRLIAQNVILGESFRAFIVAGDLTPLLDALATRGLEGLGQGLSYQLDTRGRPASFTGNPVGPNASYGALYPDGSKYLSTTGQLDAGLSVLWGNPTSLFVPRPATLFDAETGAVIPDTGVPASAAMPMFSPDGRHLVFTDAALDNARGLVVMDYDTAQHKASGRRVLLQEDPASASRPSWPFFLPDNNAVVFTRTNDPAFSGSGSSAIFAGITQNTANVDIFGTSNIFSSDLYLADVATGKVSLLSKAMGFNTPDDFTSAKTYLPFGAEDLHRNFFPTVSPVAAGGYFWVFFDTFRHYGNLGVFRQLWGFAIDIQRDGSYTFDPSHPPFYVPGQEFGGSNRRAFAALDKCQPNYWPCKTGIDCCDGFCALPGDAMIEVAEDVGTCEPPPQNSCAKLNERCRSDADCCPPTGTFEPPNVCIAGFCAFIPLL